ncbi:MAG: response regulator transcription factor [Propionibacteriaceae bacterium]|jgi:DNA-binding NarL/FixJ family response regulator|nr:response regulator transcription factor [Propionibacteriaceae bacterium]
MDQLRVLLADDEQLVRMGLRLILENDGILVAGEAGDGEQARKMARLLHPDVVLMDVRMPNLDGVAATKALLVDDPAAKIVILTTFDTDQMVIEALRAGAQGFLLKDTPPPELIEAVRRAARGEMSFSPSILRTIVGAATTVEPDSTGENELQERLSPRELEIAQAIAEGLTNTEIAARLYLSLATVKTHIGSIMAKLEAKNRTQVAVIMKRG